jgi:mannose-1-phosphate guanylyltransferase / phosphomannomutase
VKAVIMAGGKGTRLRPLTLNMPKPMVPLLGRPCMEYIVDLLKQNGITEIAVTLQYLPESIKNYFGDGSEFGVKMVYFEETSPLGTAGSVKNCEEFLDDRFLVISGDALTDFDLKKAIAFHEKNEALATIVLTKVEEPLEYGVVMTNEQGHIERFLEKPSWSEVFSDTVNTGIYILEPSVLNRFEKNKEFDFGKDLFPMLLAERSHLMGYVAEGYWSDIGNLQVYREAQVDLLERKVNLDMKVTELLPGLFAEEGVQIENLSSIRTPVFLGKGTVIESGAFIGSNTVLGRNNIVKKGAMLSQSILWDHNYVGEKAEINGSMVCHRTYLGESCTLAEGVVTGDDCRIGPKSHIKTGVKIWPNKDVAENATVHSSLIWGAKQTKNLFVSEGIKGIANMEITPDFASRLASSMATVLKPSVTVALSSCPHPFARLIKQAMTIGLNAAGIHTIDFETTISAATRYGVKAYSTHWGVHVRMDDSLKAEVATIQIFDSQGIPISKDIERKIENSYWQEDFVRASADQMGTHRHQPTVGDDYVAALRRQIQLDRVLAKRFTIVVDYDPISLAPTTFSLLSGISCKVIQIRSTEDSYLDELKKAVLLNKADFGVRLDQDGRKYVFVTNDGKALSMDIMIALHLLIHSEKESKEFCLGIPVSAPREIERLAEQLDTKVVRTKESPRDMMQVVDGLRFQPLFDGFYSMIKLIDYLAEKECSLSEVINRLPSFHMAHQAVFCDWKDKGKVMRLMMEETKGKQVELLDGIKVYDRDGWALIMPDLDQPHFRVITQGVSKEKASNLAQLYAERIQQYQLI